MSATRILRASTTTAYSGDELGDEKKIRRVSIDLNAKHRRRALRDRQAIIRGLMAVGDLAPYGCDCSHCRRDFDCCGNFTLDYSKMTPRKGGVYITQTFSRNL